jgi:hypothetical protein
MTSEKVSVKDIRNIGSYGKLTVKLPDYLALACVRNLVSYVRKAYKREDGLDYATTTDTKTNTITIYTLQR